MNTPNATQRKKRDSEWRRHLRRFFQNIRVEVAIGLLVIFSVGLTIYEVIVDNAGAIEKIEGLKQRVRLIEFINEMVTWIFVVELGAAE